MPHITIDVSPNGPCIDCRVGLSLPRAHALESVKQVVPPHMPIRGLIDTGASCSAIDPSVVRQLGLTATGTTAIQTPSTGTTAHSCKQYDVSIHLLHANFIFQIPALAVIECSLSRQGIQAL